VSVVEQHLKFLTWFPSAGHHAGSSVIEFAVGSRMREREFHRYVQFGDRRLDALGVFALQVSHQAAPSSKGLVGKAGIVAQRLDNQVCPGLQERPLSAVYRESPDLRLFRLRGWSILGHCCNLLSD